MADDVKLRRNDEGSYDDQDYPDVTWQLCEFSTDSFDCVVCDFPIEPGLHFVCLDDGKTNAHRWCVEIEKAKVNG